jgi:hypothetical protein
MASYLLAGALKPMDRTGIRARRRPSVGLDEMKIDAVFSVLNRCRPRGVAAGIAIGVPTSKLHRSEENMGLEDEECAR